MADKDKVKTPDEETEEIKSSEAPPEEPKAETKSELKSEEKSEPVEPVEGEEQPVAKIAEESPPSKRESLRIQQLLGKLKEQPVRETPKPQGLDYSKELDADDEVINRLQSDRDNVAQTAWQQGVAQAESIQFHTRLEIDAPRVEAKYPQLDKESDKFDPAVADAINTQYLYMVGYDARTGSAINPNLRYGDYVEATMELIERAAGRKVAQTSKNIAKQAASTGLRPDGSQAKRFDPNKAPEQMSDEELNAVINSSLPRK